MIQEKLNIARKLLDDTRMTIDEISIAVGYETISVFIMLSAKMCI